MRVRCDGRRSRERGELLGVDVGLGEVEVDVAARAEAFGQGGRAVADPAGIGHGAAAERAVDEQADLFGFERPR